MQGREEGVSPRFGRDCTFCHPAGMLPMQYQKEIQYQYNKNSANLQECTSLGCTDVAAGRDEGGSDPGGCLDTANGPAFVESATWNTIWSRSLTRCARTGYSVRLLTALGKHDVLPVQRELMNRFPTVIYFPRFLQFLIFTKDAQMAALLGLPTVKT